MKYKIGDEVYINRLKKVGEVVSEYYDEYDSPVYEVQEKDGSSIVLCFENEISNNKNRIKFYAGDTVRVTSNARYSCCWYPGMEEYINKIYKISSVSSIPTPNEHPYYYLTSIDSDENVSPKCKFDNDCLELVMYITTEQEFKSDNYKHPKEYNKISPIKDSGDRTEFSTGAVRDMHEGKGRMDLLPWYGIIEVAKHCEDGAKKYGEHNVDKGIPLHSLIDSASRHLAKYIVGMTDEDHLRACAWNVLWALNQRTTHPELDDLPK